MKPTRRLSISLVIETGCPYERSIPSYKWWSTLKSVMFGTSSSMPPLVSESGGLVCELVGKADLLLDHFDSKQSMEAVDLPLTCHPSLCLTSFAFRSRDVRSLLLDLDPYGALTHWVCFLSFLRELLMFWPHVLV